MYTNSFQLKMASFLSDVMSHIVTRWIYEKIKDPDNKPVLKFDSLNSNDRS